MKSDFEDKIESLSTELNRARQENEDLKEQHERDIKGMTKQFDQIAKRLKEKGDKKKKKLKDYQAKTKQLFAEI